jgi:hypothetical protein
MRSATLWWEKLPSLFSRMKGHKSSIPTDFYSETVFRELVSSESKRSERSGHLCHMLLVYRTSTQGLVLPWEVELAGKTISVLSRSCRETDYVGWYRQDRILGVLLPTLRRDSVVDGCTNLKTRLVGRLDDALAFTDDYFLRIRVLDRDDLIAFDAYDHPASLLGSKD